jgi:exopolysaccharide biosynthesis WecB/TagA/CpsF family protein
MPRDAQPTSLVTHKRGVFSYDVLPMLGEVLALCDYACLALSAWISSTLYAHWLAPPPPSPHLDPLHAALMAAVLAAFILYDKRFGSSATRFHTRTLLRAHALRFTAFATIVVLLDAVSPLWHAVSATWLTLWLAIGALATTFSRALLARALQHLQRHGRLCEVIAIVGAGPLADQLVRRLHHDRLRNVELLGIFDDAPLDTPPGSLPPCGTVAQLIELGQSRRIDWIVLALPPTAELPVHTLVQRLKALSVPIGLCSPHVGFATLDHPVDYVAHCIPVALLADRPIKHWNAVTKNADELVPRWLITCTVLPLVAAKGLAMKLIQIVVAIRRAEAAALTLHLEDADVAGFAATAAGFGSERYGFVVTPNVDHLIRLHDDASFRACYAAADYVLLDSRFLAHLMQVTRNLRLQVCPGSDLTERLFASVIAPDDPLVLIGASSTQAQALRERFGLTRLVHLNPPMGFMRDATEVENCLHFAETHSPFRFCLLALGAPQQEQLALLLKERGVARGLVLCVGASINFLTGAERRAPPWLQLLGLEWCFRLLQQPRRLARRYLVRGPRVFALLPRTDIVVSGAAVREPDVIVSTQAPDDPRHRSDSVPPANPYQTG